MLKKCSKCREFKELDNFRFMEKQNRYCAYCRACEAKYTRERRTKLRKSNLEKLWLLVTMHLSENEVDELLTRLKNIWRKEHE